MNPRFILLLTCDAGFQTLLSDALSDGETVVRVARSAGEALRVVCERTQKLDLAVVDFDDGCHGMTLLSALNVCQPDLPIVAVTSRDAYHGAAIAYANDAAVCLTKPISAAELRMVIEKLGEPKLQLACA
jgi:DNA-binding NtrC family response regulator